MEKINVNAYSSTLYEEHEYLTDDMSYLPSSGIANRLTYKVNWKSYFLYPATVTRNLIQEMFLTFAWTIIQKYSLIENIPMIFANQLKCSKYTRPHLRNTLIHKVS